MAYLTKNTNPGQKGIVDGCKQTIRWLEMAATGKIKLGGSDGSNGSASSGSSSTLRVQVRSVKDYVLSAGDAVLKFVPVEVSFVRDVQDDKSKEKFDVTTQADSVMSYAISNYIDRSGTLTGVFAPSDPVIRAAAQEFDDVLTIKVDGTFSGSKVTSKIFHFLLSRDENGDPEVWEYLPVRLESLTAGKPQKDIQPFDIGYVTAGEEKPHAIYIDKS